MEHSESLSLNLVDKTIFCFIRAYLIYNSNVLLLGWLNKVRSDTEKEDVYLGNARHYLTKAKEVHQKNPTKDKGMVCTYLAALKALGVIQKLRRHKGVVSRSLVKFLQL